MELSNSSMPWGRVMFMYYYCLQLSTGDLLLIRLQCSGLTVTPNCSATAARDRSIVHRAAFCSMAIAR